jgi:hypothetical protein
MRRILLDPFRRQGKPPPPDGFGGSFGSEDRNPEHF